ncbi:hypothetical protein CGGC5_v007147 [Colletotrichum fructicola Nara gc5]|uniref:Uncharacterized protein n=1 Tax=Colletotrichum fructicola (strain Nara gc5) TaxID=1213859 RepID=A0A7J6J561_COLFN|nr:hypothetical protein CGGC5_v007147 [Colletotrichum fructicola Nara gc5]
MEPDYANPQHGWWPRASDGRMVPLVVQTAGDPSLLPPTIRWTRLGKPISQVTLLLRLTNWVASSLFAPGTRDIRKNPVFLLITALKFIVSWPVFCVLVSWQEPMATFHRLVYGLVNSLSVPGLGVQRQLLAHSGPRGLDPYTALVSADTNAATGRQYLDNIRMDEGLVPPLPSQDQPRLTYDDNERGHQGDTTASVRPRYLCLVKDFDEGTYETINVSEYLVENGDDIDLEFVFVSYTRMHFRVATDDEISGYDYPDEETREANRALARRDRETLARWGMDAAKRVRKKAFWLDFECVRNDDGVARSTSSSEDVYRICDIVRAAHSMIIAIGPTASEKVACLLAHEESPEYRREQVTPWLRQWGSRLWTLPELLLCPAEYRIRLYVVGDPSEPKPMAKRNFAERAWDDAEAVKELVNHFEGSAILTSVNLIEAALRCFARRQTDQFSQGDIAYAIMGLFPSRLRPQVNKEDTGFQAFAKLSLANDSGAFIDRLICLSPPPGAPWYHTQDQWGARLGDIQPFLKVKDVSGSDTVILDGVYGATIQWERIDPEPYGDRSMGQFQNALFSFSFFCCTAVPVLIMIGTYVSSFDHMGGMKPPEGFPKFPHPDWPPIDRSGSLVPVKAFATIIFSAIGVFALVLPVLLIRSKRNTKQPFVPRLIGVEGFMDAGTVETYLWGSSHGNLRDVSLQSYSDTVSTPSETLPAQQAEDSFSFTLIDTHLLTVTHLQCNTPPLAMFAVSSSGTTASTENRIFVSRHILLSVNIFRAYDFNRRSYDLLNYKVSFVVGQVFSLTILSRLPLNLVFPYIFVAKVFILVAEATNDATLTSFIPEGALDGCLLSTVLVLILAWYPANELPLRLLLVTVAVPKVEVIWGCVAPKALPFRLFVAIFHFIFLVIHMMIGMSQTIGQPGEVSWLDACQTIAQRHSTWLHKFFDDTTRLNLSRRQTLARSVARIFLVFAASFLTSVLFESRDNDGRDDSSLGVTYIVITVLVGLVTYCMPPASYAVMVVSCLVPGIMILSRDVSHDWRNAILLLRVLVNLGLIVHPLLWSTILQSAQGWAEAAAAISLSCVGNAVGQILVQYSTKTWDKAHWIAFS